MTHATHIPLFSDSGLREAGRVYVVATRCDAMHSTIGVEPVFPEFPYYLKTKIATHETSELTSRIK